MKIIELKIINFRNNTKSILKFSDNYNIFIGNNGEGKTNLLEAISVLSNSKSFKTNRDEDLIKIGQDFYNIEASISKKNVIKKVRINYQVEDKKIWVDDKKINRISEFIGTVNSSVLCPEDILIIKGDSYYRRKFMDTILCQIDKIYLSDLIEYKKVLKNKNILLKTIKVGKAKITDLEPWNEKLLDLSVQIFKKRCAFLKEIERKLQNIHIALTEEKEKIKINYLDSISNGKIENEHEYEKEFKIKQKRVLPEEFARGVSLLGIHRDDIVFDLGEKNIRVYGSQGQQRIMVVSLRLAEFEYIYSEIQEYPVLLIDDIFSELDDRRKSFLLNFLTHETQIFLTGTRILEFSNLLEKAKVYRVFQGNIENYEK